MNVHSPKSSRRPSRRAQRRRQVLRVAAWVTSALLVLGAFACGFLWRQAKVNRVMAAAAAPPESSDEQKAEALRLFDEAVRARHEERAQGAMNAVTAARRADPQLRSVDVLVGEIALEQKDSETLRRAAKYALERGENESSANLLSAIEAWMRRGEQGTEKAGQLAGQFLSDAAKAEPSNAAVYFFHGELSRLLGDGRKAHRHLLAALYRQRPWRSAALLENKAQLAAREASDQGKTIMVPPPTEQAEAVLALLNSAPSGAGGDEPLTELLRITPAVQLFALVDDSALNGSRELMLIEGERLQALVETSVPYLGAPAKGAAD